jgi:hypothetical protein
VNDRNDVLTVQRLINAKLPTPLSPLDEDGVCGPLTIQAIEDIQRSNLLMPLPDGRIDPNSATFAFLNGNPIPVPTAMPAIAWGRKGQCGFQSQGDKNFR